MPGGDPFEALGNAQRRAIVLMLASRPRSVQELADELPISRPAVSRHLRVLDGAGLVDARDAGARRVYRLREEGIESLRRYVEEVWGDAATRFRLFAENSRRGPNE